MDRGQITRAGRWTMALALTGAALLAVDFGSAGAEIDESAASVVVPVDPFRILDTRQGIGTGGVVGPVGADATITVQVGGAGPVPAGATGVVLNLTATAGTDPSWVSAYPSGTDRPEASVLNITPGQDLPNMITAGLGAGGGVDLYNFAGSVHLLADVAAYLVPADSAARPGPAGPAGPQGPMGPQGPAFAGSRALTGTRVASSGGQEVASDGTSVLGTLALPAGKFVVTAAVEVAGRDVGTGWVMWCAIKQGANEVDTDTGGTAYDGFTRSHFNLTVPVTTSSPTNVVVVCSDSTGQPSVWHRVTMTAVEMQSLTEVPLA